MTSKQQEYFAVWILMWPILLPLFVVIFVLTGHWTKLSDIECRGKELEAGAKMAGKKVKPPALVTAPNSNAGAKCEYCGQLLGLGVTRCWTCGRVWPFSPKPKQQTPVPAFAVIRPRRFSWPKEGEA